MNYRIFFSDAAVEAGVMDNAALAPAGTVIPVQTHSCNVAVIKSDGVVPNLENTDAIISLAPGLNIGVRTADCVPVLLHAPDIRAVAAIHAGWKGTIGGIVTFTIAKLQELGADPARIEAAFGPSICGKCYEVNLAMIELFRNAGYEKAIIGERHLDLQNVNRIRLLKSGVREENIHPSPICTFETDALPSWRRSASDSRLLTYIRLPRLH